jgi:UDP-GlcNAc:undecaprenyl-phosphate GlcNAc-1-phosphate transferase
MTTILMAFILAFLVAVVATRIVIELALRWGVVDKPDGYRKVHKQSTPRLGGLAVYMAFLAPLAALSLFPSVSTVSELLLNLETFPKLVGLVVGGTLALVLGIVDDVFDLRPRWKLLWQIVIACVVYTTGFKIEGIGNPFGGDSIWLGNLSIPITVFWFVACMNAVNLLDGIDGLAAGASVFVGLTLFLVSLLFSNILGMFLMACLSGAAMGFLVFNFPPARIFLGDSGSLLLGFLIAALSLMGATLKTSTAVALFVPVVALGLPIFGTGGSRYPRRIRNMYTMCWCRWDTALVGRF